MNWLKIVPFAHRGLFGPLPGQQGAGVPENSLGAFAAAADKGYGIELDVQLLADGEAIVFHDDDLSRLTGRPGAVSDLTVSTVRSVRLTDSTSPPLFREVLDLVAGRVPLYIEIKNKNVPGRLEARVLELVAGYSGPFAVASFNPWVLAWFRKRAPDIPRGQIACSFRGARMEAYKKYFYRNLLFNFVTEPAFIAYDLCDLPNRAVSKTRARGLPILAWTVRTVEDLDKARAHADNFVFEGMELDLAGRAGA